jgi:L-ribulose-5-phosphate 4-epimerase
MAEREGVVKYQLEFSDGPAPEAYQVAELIAWRTLLYRLRLIGEDPARYEGVGFGNVSQRLGENAGTAFVISGTQTGREERLTPRDFCRVSAFDSARNWLRAEGPVAPSSEALTHAALYASDAGIHCVLHGHSPEIWNTAAALGLPSTAREVPYGTPAMADEMLRLLRESELRSAGIFVMAGHEDGVIAFGPSVATAGAVLATTLARALAL